MKKLFLLFLTLFSWPLFGYEVKMRVVDETGAPVVGAKASILFVNGMGSNRSDDLTDKHGEFSARGKGTDSVMLWASKDGHYPARVEGLSNDKDHDVEVVLPRVLNPIPLYAWRGDDGGAFAFPVQNEWVGLDLEAADWVAPHGKGKTADILFRFKNEFKGWKDGVEKELDQLIMESKNLAKIRKEQWTMEEFKVRAGKWDGVMEISFPNDGEGIFEEKRFLEYSQLKLPHLAPEDGYVPTWRYEACNYHYPTTRENVGFFLRTRVKRGEQGKIISANYAKIRGDFLAWVAGGGHVRIHYYFNPVPNDRNLEFDPKKNLFPKGKPGTDVFEP